MVTGLGLPAEQGRRALARAREGDGERGHERREGRQVLARLELRRGLGADKPCDASEKSTMEGDGVRGRRYGAEAISILFQRKGVHKATEINCKPVRAQLGRPFSARFLVMWVALFLWFL